MGEELQDFLIKSGGAGDNARYRMFVETLYKSDRIINLITSLKRHQVPVFAVMDWLAEQTKEWGENEGEEGEGDFDFGIDDLSTFLKELFISDNRLGRKEGVVVFKEQEPKDETRGLASKILGFRS